MTRSVTRHEPLPTDVVSRSGRRPQVLAIIGLALALGLPELDLHRALFSDTVIGARIGREIVWAGFAVLMLAWVLFVERLPLASIGLVRPSRGTIGWAAVGTVAMMAAVMLSYAVLLPMLGLQQNMTTTGWYAQAPLWLFLTTPIVAGVSEEILYRGYAIERLHMLTGRRWLAAIVAGLAFFLGHVSWGAGQMVVVGFGTVILVALYLFRRDLLCVILAHTLTDLIGFTLARAQM